jgi:hypothetical protein
MFKQLFRRQKIRRLRAQERDLSDIIAYETARKAEADEAIDRCRRRIAMITCELYSLIDTLPLKQQNQMASRWGKHRGP